ncbi:DUF1569 domain-containing protein [Kordia sp.]|uniref:DUF1569 domain-containing protein n=1 Tax=Kordia sp. TaxID=1965332 RepID=UPI0025BD9C1A|nr:DUF1569 domain-containing protein [Kordia sp.]MCH2194119.1 DUF1569 domain-containing protein [Kordia sp.]
MKSLFDADTHEEIQNRIESLTVESTPSWGKMSVAQMCTHCQKPLEVAMGSLQLGKKKLGFMKRLVFRIYKPLMYNDKPWKQDLPTVRDFIISDERDLAAEKAKLAALVTKFSASEDTTEWPAHPLFGDFTHEQWGKMQYKHLNHHLTQFGV